MGRGQYDRSTPRTKPIGSVPVTGEVAEMYEVVQHEATKLKLAEALAEIARLKRLCQTHGLWIDG